MPPCPHPLLTCIKTHEPSCNSHGEQAFTVTEGLVPANGFCPTTRPVLDCLVQRTHCHISAFLPATDAARTMCCLDDFAEMIGARVACVPLSQGRTPVICLTAATTAHFKLAQLTWSEAGPLDCGGFFLRLHPFRLSNATRSQVGTTLRDMKQQMTRATKIQTDALDVPTFAGEKQLSQELPNPLCWHHDFPHPVTLTVQPPLSALSPLQQWHQ